MALSHDDRTYPCTVEILLVLLLGNDFRRVGHCRRRQQVQFEFGNRQKQGLRRAQFSVLNFAMALGDDSAQHLATAARLGLFILDGGCYIERGKCFSTGLFCQRLGVEVLPQVIDAACDLRIVSAKVANGRNKADRCGMNV